jgi:methyl-accepting chemotaxis protein
MQPIPGPVDILDMSNVSDLTIRVLEDIRDDMRGMRADVRHLTERVDHLTERVDHLTERVETGFAEVNTRIDQTNKRLDNVVKIVGTHHQDLESRVSRIEDHLGLPRDH